MKNFITNLKSKMKFVKFYLNYARPLAKSKYNSIIDSEKVLWRNDEKNSALGVKKIWNRNIKRAIKVILIMIVYLLYNGSAS